MYSLAVAHKGFTKEQTLIQLMDELDESRGPRPSQSGYISNEVLQSLRRYIRNLKVFQLFTFLFIFKVHDSR